MKYLSIRQASEYTSLSRTTLFKALKENRLQRHGFGRRTLISINELEALVAAPDRRPPMASKSIRGPQISLERPLADDLNALSCSDEQRTVLKSVCGIEGFVHRQLMSDLQHEARRIQTLGFLLNRRGNAEMRLLEVFESLGVTPIASPLLWFRAMSGQAKNLLKAGHADGLVAPFLRIGLDKRHSGACSSYLLSGRAVVIAGPGFDWDSAEARMGALRPGGRKNPKLPLSLTEMPPDWGGDDVARWLVGIPTAPIILTEGEKGLAVRTRSAGYKGGQLARLAEGLSLLEFSSTVSGVGRRGQDIAKQLSAKMSAWQKSRLERGIIIDDTIDIWAVWAGVRMSADASKLLPLRTDIARKPPKLVKSKAKSPPEKKYDLKDRK